MNRGVVESQTLRVVVNEKKIKNHDFLMMAMSYLSTHRLMGAGGVAYHARFNQESRTMKRRRKTLICHRD